MGSGGSRPLRGSVRRGDERDASTVEGESLLHRQLLDPWTEGRATGLPGTGGDDPYGRTRDPYPVEQRRLTPDPRHRPSQQHQCASRLTQGPNSVPQFIDSVPAVDVQSQPQLRPQPGLVEHQGGHVVSVHGHRSAFGTPADPASLVGRTDLTGLDLAVQAERKALIDHRGLHRRTKVRAGGDLSGRQRIAEHGRPAASGRRS